MPENTPKNNKIEASAYRPEERLNKPDFSPSPSRKASEGAARENLDRLADRSREFEKLRSTQAPQPSSDDDSPVAPPVGNEHLDKFYNDVDDKKRGDIQKIINVVFEKGPEEGVLAARGLNDPYILDEIEKLLTMDWMHKILLERGLLQESK
ncbi:MAG TPA: hypothetical protein VJK01_01145 [Candidatus Paceibacterota bacterium]